MTLENTSPIFEPGLPLARDRERVGFLLLVSLVITAYAFAISHPFQLDDRIIVEENPYVLDHQWGTILTSSYWESFDSVLGDEQALYRPFTVLSYAINHAVLGPSPAGYRVVNVLLHLLVVGFVFLILRTWFGGLPALGGAALFALHPLQTEAVTYISGRADVLAALGFVVALWAFPRAEASTGRRRLGWMGLSCAGYGFGLMSKEIAVSLPAVLVLVDLVGERGRGGSWGACLRRVLRGWPRYASHFVVLAIFLGLRFAVLGKLAPSSADIPLLDNPLRDLTWLERIDDVMAITGRQIELLLLPLRQSIDYSFDQIPVTPGRVSDSWGHLALSVGALIAFAITAARRRAHAVTLGGGFFLITWLPISNLFVVIGTILAERILYLSSVSVALLGAAVIWRSGRWSRGMRASVLGVIVLLCAGAFYRTLVRNGDYRSSTALWESAARVCPNAARAQFNYGVNVRRRAEELEFAGKTDRAGKVREQARERFERVLAIYPDHLDAKFELGLFAWRAGQLEEARQLFRAMLTARSRESSNLPATVVNLAELYLIRGEAAVGLREIEKLTSGVPYLGPSAALAVGMLAAADGDDEQARRAFEFVLTQPLPRFGVLRQQRARTLLELARLELRAGRPEAARQRINESFALGIESVEQYVTLAEVHSAGGEGSLAEAALSEGLNRFPGSSALRSEQVARLREAGSWTEAVDRLEALLDEHPGQVDALRELAAVGRSAFEASLELRGAEPETLASAQGHLNLAVRCFSRATKEGATGARFSLALALQRLGRWEEAAQHFEGLADRRGRAEGLFRTQLGDVLRDLGRIDEARAAYEAALARDEENLGALVGMALSWLDDDVDQAARWAEKARWAGEASADAAWIALRVLEARGSSPELEAVATEFREQWPEDPRGWVALVRREVGKAREDGGLIALAGAKVFARAALERAVPGTRSFLEAADALRATHALAEEREDAERMRREIFEIWAPEDPRWR